MDGGGHFCRPLHVAMQNGLYYHLTNERTVSSLYTFLFPGLARYCLGEGSTEFTVCSKAVARLSYLKIVLRSILWILSQEHRENCVIAEHIRVVVCVPADRHCRRGRSLLERDTREGNHILILRQLEQHCPHGVVTLDDVGQTIPRRVVQHVAHNVRVDARCYSSS